MEQRATNTKNQTNNNLGEKRCEEITKKVRTTVKNQIIVLPQYADVKQISHRKQRAKHKQKWVGNS